MSALAFVEGYEQARRRLWRRPLPAPAVRSPWSEPVLREVAALDGNRHAIVRFVALKHGLLPTELAGRGLTLPVTVARQEAMWLLRTRLELSYPQIGAVLNRDHTTCISGVRAHQRRLDVEARRQGADGR